MKQNKLYNIIFPIWLLIFTPPIILLVIPANFIIDLIVLYIILKAMSVSNMKQVLKKDYLKVVGFGFLADIIGGLLLFITIFFEKLSDMSWNPYNNFLTSLYLIITFCISTYLIYLFNSKFNFKKTIKDDKKIKKISILLAIITAPYLFLVPTNILYSKYDIKSISNYYDTSIETKTKMSKIESFLTTKDDIDELTIDKDNYNILIKLKENDDYYNFYKDLEKDASLLFKTITKLNNVTFVVNNEKYNFEFNHINKIYNDKVRSNDYSMIYERYSKKNFEDSIYMGNIEGKYDLFDNSEGCSTNIVEIYEDEASKYSISCNEVEKLYIISNNDEINIKEALNNKMFNINSLSTTTLKIYREAK